MTCYTDDLAGMVEARGYARGFRAGIELGILIATSAVAFGMLLAVAFNL